LENGKLFFFTVEAHRRKSRGKPFAAEKHVCSLQTLFTGSDR